MRGLAVLVDEGDRAGLELQRGHRDREDFLDAVRGPASLADRRDHAVQQGRLASIAGVRLFPSISHVPPGQDPYQDFPSQYRRQPLSA
jgi:hypothetical protein